LPGQLSWFNRVITFAANAASSGAGGAFGPFANSNVTGFALIPSHDDSVWTGLNSRNFSDWDFCNASSEQGVDKKYISISDDEVAPAVNFGFFRFYRLVLK
jgi:hypothetical protein